MIHKTAIVDRGAKLGENVRIGPFAGIEVDVVIGDGTVIGPHVSIMRYTTLGAACEVHAGAVLGDTPQDMAFQACASAVRIGDRCVIREGVTVHRGAKPETVTEVGEGCWLMAFSHVAHNVRLGRRVILANGALLAGYVTVGDGAFISGNCGIHQFCRIGRLAMLGGNGSITKDVPPFCMLESGALNGLVGLNVVGMRRAGLSPDERLVIKRVFNLLYRSGLNVSDAVVEIRKTVSSPLAVEICEFVENSSRGDLPPVVFEKNVVRPPALPYTNTRENPYRNRC